MCKTILFLYVYILTIHIIVFIHTVCIFIYKYILQEQNEEFWARVYQLATESSSCMLWVVTNNLWAPFHDSREFLDLQKAVFLQKQTCALEWVIIKIINMLTQLFSFVILPVFILHHQALKHPNILKSYYTFVCNKHCLQNMFYLSMQQVTKL